MGAVTAREFSRLGARLVLAARSGEELERVRQGCDRPEKHDFYALDLTDFPLVEGLVEKAYRHLGEVDAVVHCAGGGLGLRSPLLTADDFSRLFNLNVLAASEINRFVAPRMSAAGRGALVHVASIAAAEAVASVGYNTVKAALAGYVRGLGNELAKENVVVTGILPGGFFAPGNSWDRLQTSKPEVVESFISERLPRGRLALAEEVVHLLMFLCSPAASMMGGCMVPIDAGEGKTILNHF